MANPDYLSYTASRFAMAGLTETLARGLAPSIGVNAVAPGHTLPSPEQTMEGFEKAQSQSLCNRALGNRYCTGRSIPHVGQVSNWTDGMQILVNDSYLGGRDVVFETEE